MKGASKDLKLGGKPWSAATSAGVKYRSRSARIAASSGAGVGTSASPA